MSVSRTFIPESALSVALDSFVCNVKHEVMHPMQFDPLGDPIRDPSIDGVGPHGPRAIGPSAYRRNVRSAQRIQAAAAAFLRQMDEPVRELDRER